MDMFVWNKAYKKKCQLQILQSSVFCWHLKVSIWAQNSVVPDKSTCAEGVTVKFAVHIYSCDLTIVIVSVTDAL